MIVDTTVLMTLDNDNHSIILEFDVPSYRTGAAQQRPSNEVRNRR